MSKEHFCVDLFDTVNSYLPEIVKNKENKKRNTSVLTYLVNFYLPEI